MLLRSIQSEGTRPVRSADRGLGFLYLTDACLSGLRVNPAADHLRDASEILGAAAGSTEAGDHGFESHRADLSFVHREEENPVE